MAIDKITTAAITDGTITSSDLASGAVPNQSKWKEKEIKKKVRRI